ncbi:unnamed protein product [Tuber aestivum]|uniref:Uncharacterized protein n=1 Tax=Tuber aestivum TaxID=59557 RepID=A0A292Q0W0_9PEZI|nr:unnamed protein product [Tuber aestivum]
MEFFSSSSSRAKARSAAVGMLANSPSAPRMLPAPAIPVIPEAIDPKLADRERTPPPSTVVIALAPSSPASIPVSPIEETLDLCDDCRERKNFGLRRCVPDVDPPARFDEELLDKPLPLTELQTWPPHSPMTRKSLPPSLKP